MLGSMLCCHCLEILNNVGEGPTFSFFSGPCKLHSWSYSDLTFIGFSHVLGTELMAWNYFI